jgi:hypothetical protein
LHVNVTHWIRAWNTPALEMGPEAISSRSSKAGNAASQVPSACIPGLVGCIKDAALRPFSRSATSELRITMVICAPTPIIMTRVWLRLWNLWNPWSETHGKYEKLWQCHQWSWAEASVVSLFWKSPSFATLIKWALFVKYFFSRQKWCFARKKVWMHLYKLQMA